MPEIVSHFSVKWHAYFVKSSPMQNHTILGLSVLYFLPGSPFELSDAYFPLPFFIDRIFILRTFPLIFF